MEATHDEDAKQGYLSFLELFAGSSRKAPSDQRVSYAELAPRRTELEDLLDDFPYSILLHLILSHTYLDLFYPDLAAGAAYKALLLCDALRDEADEYHSVVGDDIYVVFGAVSATTWARITDQLQLQTSAKETLLSINSLPTLTTDDEGKAADLGSVVEDILLPVVYQHLTTSLEQCGCYRSAYSFSSQALVSYAHDTLQQDLQRRVRETVAKHFSTPIEDLDSSDYRNPSTWPDTGHVRRERYSWNGHEPDRFESLPELNQLMAAVAPNLEVRTVNLPDLTASSIPDDTSVVKQLGIFAKRNVAPGELILDETSFLTANNRLQDALCDACNGEMPTLDISEVSRPMSCEDCEVVFCSQHCYTQAMELYHPALCEKDIDTIAKDVPPAEAADALYSLLLLRSLAMAETQACHPLDLNEIKYIWGDFRNLSAEEYWNRQAWLLYSDSSDRLQDDSRKTLPPRALPFSFEYNIRLPLHMLEKMDINIFTTHRRYDVWVFNTLYAKFRGTASARLSGSAGGRARGPEVSAVHLMWCLANHSCDPNVKWEWGGSIKFWAREKRKAWAGREAQRDGLVAIKKDEEILNHYCDIDLPVHDRREWARGALGGDCRCERCVSEAGEAVCEEH